MNSPNWRKLMSFGPGGAGAASLASLTGLAALVAGWLAVKPLVCAAGAAVLGWGLLKGVPVRAGPRRGHRVHGKAAVPVPGRGAAGHAAPDEASQRDVLVNQMLAQGRFALLLRPQVAAQLSAGQLQRAWEALEQGMALVPDGDVELGPPDEPLPDDAADLPPCIECPRRVLRVERFFLDRYPVTNAQYFEFVAQGGYEQAALWDASVLPAVLDFVDATGQPGPRYWQNGHYPTGKADHPVVGVCWYEAAAYARWVGKRLPSDAEWVKAAAWPVTLADGTRVQRRYPWGDLTDRARANLWGTGPGETVAVTQYPDGASVGGVYQLIGNVWEWTRSAYGSPGPAEGCAVLGGPYRSLRGGAFDTYFDNQATCQFQSGEAPLARKHNIGFRCAISARDLCLPRRPTETSASVRPATGWAVEVSG